MKATRTIFVMASLMLGFVFLFGCSTPAPTPVPPTFAPTSAPTLMPPTAAPTATNVPATNPPATIASANANKIVSDAFVKFHVAKSFRMTAKSQVSPIFFQPQNVPVTEGKVLIFDMQVEQNGADSAYELKGFVASFIGLFSGFDPASELLDIVFSQNNVYMRGKLENETQLRWYKLSPQDAQGMTFTPTNLLAPMSEATYGDNAFSKTGSETLGAQTCDVYTGSRAAFDAVFPKIAQSALLSEETLTLETIDRAEFQVSVCADGRVYRIAYNFDAHSKTDASKKGSFTFDAQLADYDADIKIQAPSDAVDMPGASGTTQPTTEPTTPTETKNFDSLEGEWEGTDTEDSPISFRVENNAITFANLNYFVNTGGCSFSGTLANSVDDAAIKNSEFTLTLTNSDDVKFTLKGKFESNNAASGTLAVQGKTFCGDTDAETKWTARHTGAPESADVTPEATEAPTAEATDEPEPTQAPATNEGGKIVQAAFDALAKNDVDGALAYFDPNVIYDIAGTSGIGTQTLRSNLQLAGSVGTKFAVSNIQDLGGIVTFTVTVTGFGAGTYSDSSVIVQNGKIMILTVK